MRNGDLSNVTPRRALVALPYVAMPPPGTTFSNRLRRRQHRWTTIATQYTLLPATIAHLLRLSTRHGLLMELFAIGIDAEEMAAVVARLDAGQAHPFTHAACYATMHELVSTLPFRTEVLGVIDTPDRGLMYGSWFMSTAGL